MSVILFLPVILLFGDSVGFVGDSSLGIVICGLGERGERKKKCLCITAMGIQSRPVELNVKKFILTLGRMVIANSTRLFFSNEVLDILVQQDCFFQELNPESLFLLSPNQVGEIWVRGPNMKQEQCLLNLSVVQSIMQRCSHGLCCSICS